jgi:hypothetical protein
LGRFADATYQLEAAVAQNGSTVSDELRYTEGDKETAEQLDQAWKESNQAFEAIAAYSDSLEINLPTIPDGRISQVGSDPGLPSVV